MSDLDSILQPIADAIKKGKKVTFFNGAGISTSAGIPDFRSPESGLYANLAKLNLPFAEAVFDLDFFMENPQPFYTLASELYPGSFAPTKFHQMIKLLQDQNSLSRVYTQNIDTLERLAGVEDKYIVEAHGSFATNHCVQCHSEMDTETLKKDMKENRIPSCRSCEGYVKPDIVFFGEGLPKSFFKTWSKDSKHVEIAIVAGTSLTVQPFAFLPSEVGKKALRILINKEKVGDFKHHPRKSDIIVLNDCDLIAEKLCGLLGIEDKLNELYEKGKSKYSKPETKEELVHDIEEKLKSEANLKQKEPSEEQEETTPKKEDKEEEELTDLVDKLKI
ncbi:HST2 NAD-dependent protein deacetylase HST2 [Candida maltosa Xu316]|uniref:NAD-dependent protein deacetylase n=1 Tax=Candida maltosa (strain Xu316) TaxID=1245528 RepID=M3JA99_CANMX|nr:hypothetical protein G210_0294 [Candida maltosa Xu316]